MGRIQTVQSSVGYKDETNQCRMEWEKKERATNRASSIGPGKRPPFAAKDRRRAASCCMKFSRSTVNRGSDVSTSVGGGLAVDRVTRTFRVPLSNDVIEESISVGVIAGTRSHGVWLSRGTAQLGLTTGLGIGVGHGPRTFVLVRNTVSPTVLTTEMFRSIVKTRCEGTTGRQK